MSHAPRLVILDTDPGVDDALALLYLRARPELTLLAITTVFGNADVETTTRNALYLRQRLGLDVPVYRGAAAPLQGPRGPSPLHVHGENGLGDLDLGDFIAPPVDPGAAHERILEAVRAHPGAVTLVAIGPLTNLALALRAAPDIARQVAEVVIMGGAFGGGNVTPYAEANIHNDPDAAAAVFAADWPITLVPLDATMSCVLSNAAAASLAHTAGDGGRLAHDVSRGYAAAYAEHEGLDGCVLHDVAALAWLVRPDLFEAHEGPVTITLDKERRGQSLRTNAPSNVQTCLAACGQTLAAHFVESLQGSTSR
ncbi:nucleoside hydrolase [Caulobacter sp. RHG1]|uniref:nucleoside hydrolase n=1 Tax=Caulobacter sp. (strain RHG1) TaxID=2545762 RepID=UPI0015546E31|nr:nucleoside hydrolase [Caulobacter sp. RHG1]NQE64841.1 Inosine-uridine preferring nucleoside hydrolase [Caulobacter sp. RHG1]